MQEQRRTSSATDDPTEWLHYWRSFGDRYVADDEPWRTQPLISPERQQLLAARLAVAPDIEESRFPFKDIALTRADIEWLLDAHRDGQGPLEGAALAVDGKRDHVEANSQCAPGRILTCAPEHP